MLPIEKNAIQTLGYTNEQWDQQYNNNSIEYKSYNQLTEPKEIEAASILCYNQDEGIPFYRQTETTRETTTKNNRNK